MLEALQMFSFIEDEEVRAKAVEQYEASLKTVTDGVQATVDEAVAGLQSKNAELLGEKKSIQEKLLTFKDITDPEKALEALNFINDNEDAQLIKDGKIGELIDRRTSTMRIDHDNAVKELADKLEAASGGEVKYKGLYETKIMDDALRAVATTAGVRPEAITDVLLRAKGLFTLDKEGGPEARDSAGNLRKNADGNVLTAGVWMEDLKTSSPHYWPSSEGAGAQGGHVAVDADTTAKLADLAKKGDMPGYRRLRAQMSKGV